MEKTPFNLARQECINIAQDYKEFIYLFDEVDILDLHDYMKAKLIRDYKELPPEYYGREV